MAADGFMAAFDAMVRLAPGAWAVLEAGAIVRENAAFVALRESGGLFHLEGRTLHTKRTDEDEMLQAGLGALSQGDPRALICLRSREGYPVFLIDLLLVGAPGLIVMRVVPVSATPPSSVRRLSHIFGFTPTEARIAIALEAGLSLEAIAKSNGTGVETVRGQVKSIRAKAGARSQSQVVAMLAHAAEGWNVI